MGRAAELRGNSDLLTVHLDRSGLFWSDLNMKGLEMDSVKVAGHSVLSAYEDSSQI